ncbi:MAG TPA: hypothetical protein VJ583_03305 [Nitrososphaeraceae archaeon]|nr:hypothetical protein [Nitrososphaeraceae archaeon]
MNITGHNSYSGCRFCNIEGVYSHKHKHIYFPSVKENYSKKNHLDWLSRIQEIEAATTNKEKDSLIKKYGNYIVLLLNYYYKLFNLIFFI